MGEEEDGIGSKVREGPRYGFNVLGNRYSGTVRGEVTWF
jgi:hypothetical protein